jgi:hypothetical protein
MGKVGRLLPTFLFERDLLSVTAVNLDAANLYPANLYPVP